MRKEDLIDFDKLPSPCFVIDERLIERNLKLLNQVKVSAGATVLCALKGYAAHATFPLLKQYLSGATASSLHEAKLIYEKMGQKAHLCAPVYEPDEFDEILGISTHLTFNSLSEVNRYAEQIKRTKDVSFGIRINPEYSEVETDLYNPARPESRLGVVASALGDELPEGIEGIHFHCLCEQDSGVLERTLERVEEKFGALLHQAKWLNMGGGHHVTRSDYDIDHLIALINNLKSNYNIEVIIEPGEAVGLDAGYLQASVLDVLDHGHIKTAMLNVSFAAHMPDCLEMPYKPNVVGAIIENDFFPTYKFGGNTCLAGDEVGNYTFIQQLDAGDRIIFHDMAHYTMVKTNHFNGVNHPSIGIYRLNGEFDLVREFRYEDYRDRLS